MGIGKAGLQLGKEIIAWTRTSGSKSSLAMKQVKINPAELKYASQIYPDSTSVGIKFKQYKNMIISYLTKNNPKEYMVIADKKTGEKIISSLGDESGCGGNINYSKLPLNEQTSVLLHGHPTIHSKGIRTTTISVPDFRTFLRLPLNECVAYNEFGEFASIRKLDNFTKPSEENVDNIIETLYTKLEQLIPKEKLKKN